MKLLGFEVSRVAKEMSVARSSGWGWLGGILESFPGAWQRNIVADRKENLLAFSAVYACISIIAEDISKLRPEVVIESKPGIWTPASNQSPFWKPIKKPNAYQTRIQFFLYWVIMKLLYGNAYIFLEREPTRKMVVNMYVLDSRRVVPLIAEDGSVWYQINDDKLSAVNGLMTLPASEVIHDRGMTLFHPLCGVSPIFACGSSATQGIRIQNNSAKFFENMSRPSGQLYSPNTVKQETAQRLKEEFEKNFSAGNLGRMFVGGDGLKYEAITIPASDAQLIEQLRWTVEDVARCFRVPLHKISSSGNVTFSNVGAQNQDYYSQTLQSPIECIELCLKEGLGMSDEYDVRFDIERGLMRMDPLGRAEVNSKKIAAGYFSPNEARAEDNLEPVKGGDTPYLQQQNFSLAALADRDKENPLGKPPPAPAPAPAPASAPAPPRAPPPAPPRAQRSAEEGAAELAEKLIRMFQEDALAA